VLELTDKPTGDGDVDSADDATPVRATCRGAQLLSTGNTARMIAKKKIGARWDKQVRRIVVSLHLTQVFLDTPLPTRSSIALAYHKTMERGIWFRKVLIRSILEIAPVTQPHLHAHYS
jgi:hypothetical protein